MWQRKSRTARQYLNFTGTCRRTKAVQPSEFLLNLPFLRLRSIIKELPRVMIIYDVDVPLKEARKAISFHFRKNSQLQDGK